MCNFEEKLATVLLSRDRGTTASEKEWRTEEDQVAEKNVDIEEMKEEGEE